MYGASAAGAGPPSPVATVPASGAGGVESAVAAGVGASSHPAAAGTRRSAATAAIEGIRLTDWLRMVSLWFLGGTAGHR